MHTNTAPKILTPRQKEVLYIIRNSITHEGKAPTIRELAKELQLSPDKSTRAISKHLHALEKKGYIYRSGQPRGIKLVHEKLNDSDFAQIPILGYANAGQPLMVAEEENLGQLEVDKRITGNRKNLFAVVIKGDSMNEVILNGVPMTDGNYAIIDKDSIPQKDDLVLATVDNCATIKHLIEGEGMIILAPESRNTIHRPIYIKDEADLYKNGTVIAVLENPKSG